MLQIRMMASIFFAALLIANAEWTQAQSKLPSGAHVRLGTLDSLHRTSANGLALTDLNTGEERVVTELARGKPSWISPAGRMLASCIDDALYQVTENSPSLAESILVWDIQGLR